MKIPAVVYVELDDGKNKFSIWGTVPMKSFELNIPVVCDLDPDDGKKRLPIWETVLHSFKITHIGCPGSNQTAACPYTGSRE